MRDFDRFFCASVCAFFFQKDIEALRFSTIPVVTVRGIKYEKSFKNGHQNHHATVGDSGVNSKDTAAKES